MNQENLSLENLKVSNLPELQGWKDKQENLVKENPFVEITDNKTYEVACKSRTALLKGRTSLEGQDKLIASKLAGFRKDVKSETEKLISITLPHEEKQQVEVKRYESIKENERLERERIENERILAIKNKIEYFESSCYKIIQESTILNINESKSELDNLFLEDFDYQEYDVMFEQSKSRLQSQFDEKCSDIQEKESQRIENERLKQEIFEVRVNRFKELGFELEDNIMFRSTELPHTYTKSELQNIDSDTFERAIENLKQAKKESEQAKIDADNLERETKLQEEKEQIFEIRKNRLLEAGLKYSDEHDTYFVSSESDFIILHEDAYYASPLDFEDIISDAKKAIEKSKSDKIELEKQIEKDLELAKADAEKLKKENKARIKRLVNDKKIISDGLEVYFADLHLDTENQETKDFIEKANAKIQALKNELLTELNNL